MKNILTIVFLSSLIFGCAMKLSNKDPEVYKNKNYPIEDRINDLVNRMTLEEKIEMLGGTGFDTKPIDRLGIPSLKMTDGPLGVRWKKSTALPSGISMAATWDPDLINKLGSVLAAETKAKGRNTILGPCVNIARIPMGGRNFESFGEDPYLTSRIAVDYINGVQKENVVATVKHFAANNQEYQRDFVNTIVDERALNEIYFPSFKAAVKEANVLAVMSAYNKLNGFYCSENDDLLINKLKEEWNFDGLVMSDWGAVHSAIPTFNSGLEVEMPEGKYLNQENLLEKIKSGELSESKLDDKVRRILRVMFKIGLFDDYKYDETQLNTKEHKQLALDVAKEGIVLLKNENSILPIDIKKIKSLAIIGPNANIAITGGGGSSMVTPTDPIAPLEALKNKTGRNVKINFAQGCILDGDSDPIEPQFLFTDESGRTNGLNAEYFDNKNLSGEPVKKIIDKRVFFNWDDGAPFSNFPSDNFSVRWSGYLKTDKSGRYTIDVSSDDGVRLYIDDKLVIDDWNDHAILTNSYNVNLKANKFYKIKLEYYENSGAAVVKFGWRSPNDELLNDAINTAKNSDIAIVFAGTNYNYESEGFDRKVLTLPNDQDELINQIAKVNKNTIVVLTTGSPVVMNEWIGNVRGIIESWFGGEQIGNAVSEVLLGQTNPSGKLPITFPVKWEDCSAYNTYKKEDGVTRYTDGIYVGYRHFEKNKIKPLFPFGYGLSYTNFEYSDINLSKNEMIKDESLIVSAKIKNIGDFDGKEIVQLYISDVNSSIDRPLKELKGFKKVLLKAGEEKTVEFTIDKYSLSFFDPNTKGWKAEPGEFKVLIGSSSEDIKLTAHFILK